MCYDEIINPLIINLYSSSINVLKREVYYKAGINVEVSMIGEYLQTRRMEYFLHKDTIRFLPARKRNYDKLYWLT